MQVMVIPVVEFSRKDNKIRKIFENWCSYVMLYFIFDCCSYIIQLMENIYYRLILSTATVYFCRSSGTLFQVLPEVAQLVQPVKLSKVCSDGPKAKGLRP